MTFGSPLPMASERRIPWPGLMGFDERAVKLLLDTSTQSSHPMPSLSLPSSWYMSVPTTRHWSVDVGGAVS